MSEVPETAPFAAESDSACNVPAPPKRTTAPVGLRRGVDGEHPFAFVARVDGARHDIPVRARARHDFARQRRQREEVRVEIAHIQRETARVVRADKIPGHRRVALRHRDRLRHHRIGAGAFDVRDEITEFRLVVRVIRHVYVEREVAYHREAGRRAVQIHRRGAQHGVKPVEGVCEHHAFRFFGNLPDRRGDARGGSPNRPS